MKKIITILFFCPLLGCSKNNDSDDAIEPIVALISPFDGQTFAAGAPISISGTISDNERIAEVHIHVRNTATNILLMDVHLSPSTSTASFNETITASAGTSYTIQIIARDRGGNEGGVTVQVSCI